VDLHLVVRAGGSVDPTGGEGLAALMAEMLDEGTATRSALELADAFDRLGARLAIEAGWDGTTLALHVLRPRLEAALALFGEVVRTATLPESELRRKRAEAEVALLREDDDPATVANKALAAMIYGVDHRYGVPLQGTRPSVAALSRDALARFHATRYAPSQSFLVAAGDVDGARFVDILEREIGGWNGDSEAEGARIVPPARTMRTIGIVDRPGAPQSEIRLGHDGPPRSTPDYFPLLVLNTILGGAFTSRLNRKLREEKGFTYGARSRYALRACGGPFTAGVAVFTGDTAEALADCLAEVGKLRDEGVEERELARARRYLALGLVRRFETVEQTAALVADAEQYGLGDDHYQRFADRVGAVTAEDIIRAAAVHLDPEHAKVVVVGDRARIRESLERLDAGPVIDLDDAATRRATTLDDEEG
jgi:predicted Zn-dependent peptidase